MVRPSSQFVPTMDERHEDCTSACTMCFRAYIIPVLNEPKVNCTFSSEPNSTRRRWRSLKPHPRTCLCIHFAFGGTQLTAYVRRNPATPCTLPRSRSTPTTFTAVGQGGARGVSRFGLGDWVAGDGFRAGRMGQSADTDTTSGVINFTCAAPHPN